MRKDPKKIARNPLFDMFAIQPTFYINGKENHSTYCGCIMTALFGLVMGAIFVYYYILFHNKVNYTVSMTSLSEENYPTINLKEKGFFLAVGFKDGDKLLDYREIEEKVAKLVAYNVQIDFSTNPATVERTNLALKDCDSINLSKDALKGSQSIFNKDSRCLEFDDDIFLVGSDTEANFSYIEMRLETCDEMKDTCKTKGLNDKSAIDYQKTFDAAYEVIRNVQLRYSFLDISADASSFNEPMTKNINSNHFMMLSLQEEKFKNFYFGGYEINTISGWLTTQNETVNSIFLDSALSEGTYRDPTYVETFKGKDGEVSQKLPYGTIRIMASNKKVSVERTYETLIDVLGTVGGIAETLTFIFAILTFLHQDIRLEQKLLNEGLLQHSEERGGGIVHPSGGFGTTKVYNYWEVLCYKYFGFCKKGSSRYKEYNRDVETMQERLDIRRVISNSGNLNVMANIFLEGYQLKLIPYLNNKSEDKDVKFGNISNKEALNKAQDNMGKSEYQKAVDEYILKHLDKDFMQHYDDEGISNLVDRGKNMSSEMNTINRGSRRIDVI